MAGRSAQTVNSFIRLTDVNNTGNRPIEYTLDDTCLRTGKIRPQEDSIRLLRGPTQNMAGSPAQTVNNMPADVCMDRGKVAEQ